MDAPRRLRRSRTVDPFAGKAEEEAQKILQSIASYKKKANAALLAIKQEEERLFALMKKAKLPSVEVAEALATIARSAGKTQNIVDPKGLQKLLPPADFYQCVSVSVAKAKEFLSAKVLAGITTPIPATAGPEELKIKFK